MNPRNETLLFKEAEKAILDTLDPEIVRSRKRVEEILQSHEQYKNNPFLNDPSMIGHLLLKLHSNGTIQWSHLKPFQENGEQYELSDIEHKYEWYAHIIYETKKRYEKLWIDDRQVNSELLALINDYVVWWGLSNRKDPQTLTEIIESPAKKMEIFENLCQKHEGEKRQWFLSVYSKK